MVRSPRLGSASQAPRDHATGTRGNNTCSGAAWSTGTQLRRHSVPNWALSVRCNSHLGCNCAQFLHQHWVRTTLVQLFYCLGLVYLLESHGMQGGYSLSISSVSLGREKGRKLTGLGWETRVPPQVAVLFGHNFIATTCSTDGSPHTPWYHRGK